MGWRGKTFLVGGTDLRGEIWGRKKRGNGKEPPVKKAQ